MLRISYRTKRFFQKVAIFLLAVVLLAVAAGFIWVIWLERYVVYSKDGAVFNFNLDLESDRGIVATKPINRDPIDIHYNDGVDKVDTSFDLAQLSGFYADTAYLRGGMAEVRKLVESLPAGTPVMIDMKNISGYFHYTTHVGGSPSGSVDITAMDDLVDWLDNSGLYTIARIPAFQEYHYFSGDRNLSHGLATSKGYLYFDKERTYWMNPASKGTIAYLIQIINELKALGFNEVVLDGFQFPNTKDVVFGGDKAEALASCASQLVAACGSDSFAISFSVESPTFVLPEGRCRMYLENVDASKAKSQAEKSGMDEETVKINLVFLTETQDTRFNTYSVLRPLSSAHFDTEQ